MEILQKKRLTAIEGYYNNIIINNNNNRERWR